MGNILTGSIDITLKPVLARGSTWLDNWLPAAWNTVQGVLPDTDSATAIADVLGQYTHTSGFSDAERLYNAYSEPAPGAMDQPGWLSTVDPYFADRDLVIPTDATMGYTVTLDDQLAELWSTTVNAFFSELTFAAVDEGGAATQLVANSSGLWFVEPDYDKLPVDTVLGEDHTITLTVTRVAEEENAVAREAAVDVENQPIDLGTSEVTNTSDNLDGSGAPEGRVTFKLYQGIPADVRVPLRSDDGTPITVPETYTAMVVYREGSCMKSIATGGTISGSYATFEAVTSGLTGMFECQLWLMNADNEVQRVVPVYVVIVHTGLDAYGVNLVAKVRSRLMDDRRENNLLLNDFEFDTQDIISAASSAVDLYNSTGRPTNLTLQSMKKAATGAWEMGIRGLLLQSAAYRYERNRMTYQAGDVALNDQDKAASYLRMAQPLIDDFVNYVAGEKARQFVASRNAWGTY